ncbi:Rrf2 family transcriptional regulator [Polaribacter sp. Z014]|uniref:Rrf2 family transcriptional regulator n=1 Tax=unclassified Polaribacter TaxID=196858 RepID=UPI0024C2F3CE|nr:MULTISPECIES: Rrf2 family transcriptional regulator [unclassified Polaribacter]MCL7764153.1 Rrf2 family transcriptional regulator [Polaribacter sp. Z014]
MIKTRFSIALHIMTLLAMYKEDWLTSTLIAESLNINPVLVRKELATLKEGGLIQSKEGKHGGINILKDANKIYLSEIFNLIKGDDNVLSLLKNTPNPNCKVGKQINTRLESLLNTIDTAISEELKKQTLEEFKNQF